MVHYFADEAAADAALGHPSPAEALALAGAWSDLDRDAMADALDRMRRETAPALLPPG